MNYYYFAASLPTLSLDERPPFSSERFRALCGSHLSRNDLQALDELTADGGAAAGADSPRPAHAYVAAWRNHETQVRNAVARARGARHKRDAAPFLREADGFDLSVERAVSDAFARPTPLAREQALDRFRWSRAGELAGYNPFGTAAILAYALQLRLSERWAAMSAEQGRQTAESIVLRNPGNEPKTA